MKDWEKLKAWVNGDEREAWYSPKPERNAAGPQGKAEEKVPDEIKEAKHKNAFQIVYFATGAVVSVVLLAALLAVVIGLPLFADEAAPMNNELSAYYIEHGLADGGAANLVANIIMGYRAFDTFGESCVLFLAAASVMMLMTRDSTNTGKKLLDEYHREDAAEAEAKDSLLRTSTRILLPTIFTYGVYVILNGHISPGGGFAGGTILGAGLILFAQEFGNAGVSKFFSEHLYHIIKVTALAVYGLLLLYYVFMGVNGLDNHIWLGIPGTILSSGIILPINFMVGFEVACTIYAFYALFHKGEL